MLTGTGVDLAPFLGLTAATAFLGRYRIAFSVVGLAVNAVGVAISVQTLTRLTGRAGA